MRFLPPGRAAWLEDHRTKGGPRLDRAHRTDSPGVSKLIHVCNKATVASGAISYDWTRAELKWVQGSLRHIAFSVTAIPRSFYDDCSSTRDSFVLSLSLRSILN